MSKEWSLDNLWKFIELPPDNHGVQEPRIPESADFYEGCFPGSIQGALMDCGKIGSPFFAHDHENFRWIEDTDWYLVKEFQYRSEANKRYILRFDGIDGVGRVYLNGHELGFVQNMFTPYEFDVTGLLRDENKIGIRFYSYVKIARSRDRRGIMAKDFGEGWPSDRDWYCASFIRKGNFACGEDMSQRLMTVGLWKPVKILEYQVARILGNQVITELDGDKAQITLNTELENFLNTPVSLKLIINIRENNTAGCPESMVPANDIDKNLDLYLGSGIQKVSYTLPIENPKLWWPNSTGEEQHLYTLQTDLAMENVLIDSRKETFGIREIKLVQEPDEIEGGRTFTIEVNGRKVFCKGANWVPADTLIYPVEEQRYETLLSSARDANFNMLRVNGFGIYESTQFYDLCDRYGIMIWQDFMFSDCVYDDEDADFLSETRRECEIVLKMLRNHPCLVLWCGNNEIQWMCHDGNEPRLCAVWGKKIFHELMPEMIKRLDPTRPYWPGSPWSETDEAPNSLNEGNCHLYPWLGMSPVEMPSDAPYDGTSADVKWSWENISWRAYTRNHAKFFSEYGLRGFPDVSTMKKVIPEEKLWPMDKEEYQYHCTSDVPVPHLIDRMNILIGKEYKDPASIRSIEEYTFYTQLIQGKTLQFAAELHRRRMYSCSGSVFWQYNDCWPCSTFSVIDYYLRKKAGFYFVKRAFAPILLSFQGELEANQVEVWVVNDLSREINGKFALNLLTFDGQPLWQSKKELTITRNSAMRIAAFDGAEAGEFDKGETFLRAQFMMLNEKTIEAYYLFKVDREMHFPKCTIKTSLQMDSSEEGVLELRTDNFARVVAIDIDGDAEDNYFDMAPGSTRRIRIRLNKDLCGSRSAVEVKAING